MKDSEWGRRGAEKRWESPEWKDPAKRTEFGKARAADRWGKAKKVGKTRAKKVV